MRNQVNVYAAISLILSVLICSVPAQAGLEIIRFENLVFQNGTIIVDVSGQNLTASTVIEATLYHVGFKALSILPTGPYVGSVIASKIEQDRTQVMASAPAGKFFNSGPVLTISLVSSPSTSWTNNRLTFSSVSLRKPATVNDDGLTVIPMTRPYPINSIDTVSGKIRSSLDFDNDGDVDGKDFIVITNNYYEFFEEMYYYFPEGDVRTKLIAIEYGK